MGSSSLILLLVLAVLSLTGAFQTFVPEGKEVVYEYKALIDAGALEPVPFSSELYLFGKVHLQRLGTSVLVKLSNVTFKLYNGEATHKHANKAKEIPIPQETADLLRVFEINYDETGKVISISTETEENHYSRNIKKAIASIMQIDMGQVDLESNTTHVFRTIEKSLHGKSNVLYNVLPMNEKVIVEKMLEMESTLQMYQHMDIADKPLSCEVDYEEPLSRDSQQMYEIVERDGQEVVERIQATGGIYMYPYQGKSEAFYIYVTQNFDLTEVTPVQEKLEIKSEKHTENLQYFVADLEIETGSAPDLTNGRHIHNMENYIQSVEQMLNEIVEYLNEDHIHTQEPNYNKGQLINRIVHGMVYLDDTAVEQLYNTLSGKTSDNDKKILEIFHQILPLIGSRATVLQIKNLAKNKKVDERIAMDMLQTMPFYVKVPNDRLLEALEEMINWGTDKNWNIRKAAILSFSNVVSRNRDWLKRVEQQDSVNNPAVKKYVEQIANMMMSADDYETQMVFMEALFNIPSSEIVKHLEPVVKGELKLKDSNMRLLAMNAVTAALSSQPEVVFEMLWPILNDRTMDSEIRITAYYLIMSTQPNISRLLNIDWLLQDEPCHELYNYHYSFLQNWMHTTDPCHQRFRLNIAQLLTGTNEPNHHAWSHYYHIDYKDKKYAYGSGMTASFINTEQSTSLYIDITSQVFNTPVSVYSAFLKIEGVEESIARKFQLLNDDSSKLFNYDELWNLITSIPNMKDIKILYIIMERSQIVQSYFMESSNIKDVLPELLQLDSLVRDSIQISYDMYGSLFSFNDLGMPVVVENLVPIVSKHDVKVSSDNENKVVTFHIDNHYKTWQHSRNGLSFYNPIADVWQGVTKKNSYDSVMPIYADISVNVSQQELKITMPSHEDEKENVMGFRHHVTSMVYVLEQSDQNILTDSCPQCKAWSKITRGERYAINKTIENEEDYNTGLNYLLEVYDSDRNATLGHAQKLQDDLFSTDTKNFQTPWGHFLLYLSNNADRMVVSPTPGTAGVMLKISPSTVNPVTQIDLALHMTHEITHENDVFLPGMKFTTSLSYSLKNNDKVVRTWDLTTDFELNPGQTVNNLKMQLTRIIPGQKNFSICMESVKTWSQENVAGNMNIALGETTEGDCNKDEASLDIEMLGEQLEAQKTPYHTYGRCQSDKVYQNEPDYHGMYCTAAHTSIRKYTYNIKATNFPTEYKKSAWKWFETVKSGYMPYFTYSEEQEQIADNNIKVEVVYPLLNTEINVKVLTPEHNFKFESIPIHEWNNVGLTPDNTHYSQILYFMHTMGLMSTCSVSHDSIRRNNKADEYQVPNEWTALVSNVEKDAQHGVFVKKIEGNKLALKLMHGTHSVEITPEGEDEDFKIMVDGKEQTGPQDEYSEDWFIYMVRPKMHSVVLTTFHFQLHMEYDGDHLYLEIPQTNIKMFGDCVDV